VTYIVLDLLKSLMILQRHSQTGQVASEVTNNIRGKTKNKAEVGSIDMKVSEWWLQKLRHQDIVQNTYCVTILLGSFSYSSSLPSQKLFILFKV